MRRLGPKSFIEAYFTHKCFLCLRSKFCAETVSALIMGLAVARRGGIGHKQKTIIKRESTLSAGQAGKVPGAPPWNPTDARPRPRIKKKKQKRTPLKEKCAVQVSYLHANCSRVKVLKETF